MATDKANILPIRTQRIIPREYLANLSPSTLIHNGTKHWYQAFELPWFTGEKCWEIKRMSFRTSKVEWFVYTVAEFPMLCRKNDATEDQS